MQKPGHEGQIGGVAGWLLGWLMARLRARERAKPRLALVERIALAPRQSLALVEAEGRRILVATSAEGRPAFHVLDERECMASKFCAHRSSRVSW
jgi:flagellar biogenesis protein FliO